MNLSEKYKKDRVKEIKIQHRYLKAFFIIV
jgi:hypothetical protein